MDRVEFKKRFIKELKFFNVITSFDLKDGFTITQTEDNLIRFSSSFYGSRMRIDKYAVNKAYFVVTFAYQIIKGNLDIDEINELCNEIEQEEKISESKH